MAIGNILTSLGVEVGGTYIDNVLLRQGRSIAGIIPDCVIEERHKDELEITQHPVENGAPITDHAFKRPAEVTIRAGWTNSNLLQNLLTSGTSGLSVTDVYQQLINLQESVQPFEVITGKRIYENMLLRSLGTTTNQDTENSMIIEAVFREVQLVSTQVSSLSTIQNQANPGSTAAPSVVGPQQLQQVDPATESNIEQVISQ